MKYVTIKDKAIEWNITERQVQNYCRKGRILDATKHSGVWQIPENATKPSNSNKTPLRVLSLFSGCGGMDLGFEGDFTIFNRQLNTRIHPDGKTEKIDDKRIKLPKTRFATVFANDIKASAKQIWSKYFSDKTEHYYLDSIVDLVKLHQNNKIDIFPKNIDVVTGGFPCQDFSIAGKRLGFESKMSHKGILSDIDAPTAENRGTLYMWMREVIAITQPKIFIAENVKGLTNLGDTKAIIEADFASISDEGYFVFPAKTLHAADYGVPQSRERVIFIGLKKSAIKPNILHKLNNLDSNMELDPYPEITHSLEEKPGLLPYFSVREALDGLLEPNETEDIDQKHYSGAKFMGKHCQGQIEVNLDGIAPTIRSEHHGNIEFRRLSLENGGKYINELNNGMQERRLTIRECARIQTFPDEFQFIQPGRNGVSTTNAYKAIGNAVPPLMAFHIAKRLENLWSVYFTE